MKIMIEIPDSEASFGIKVLQSLSFVKQAKPLSDSYIKLFTNLSEAADEVRLYKQGEIQLKTAQELLNEL